MSTLGHQDAQAQPVNVSRPEAVQSHVMPRFATEPPLLQPAVLSILLVLIPSYLLWYYGTPDSSRAFLIFWGNWISPLILWTFALAFFYLLMKRSRIGREQQATELLATQIIPAAAGSAAIAAEPAQVFQRLYRGLIQLTNETTAVENLLLLRCRRRLVGIAAEHEVEGTMGLYEQGAMHGSYAIARFLIGAIPILGFIGTVWGISFAVTHFATSMSDVQSAGAVTDALRNNLPLVTSGLATAFDTTFVALLLSLPLMLLMTWTEKNEEAYLRDLEQRWHDEIEPKIAPAKAETALAAADSGVELSQQISLLATQVAALQHVMQDLHETVFSTSKPAS